MNELLLLSLMRLRPELRQLFVIPATGTATKSLFNGLAHFLFDPLGLSLPLDGSFAFLSALPLLLVSRL